MGFTGGLEKLLVEAYTDESYGTLDKSMRLLINPEKYTRTYTICYSDRQGQGSPGGSPQFNKIPSEKMKLELVFDGTGVVPGPLPGILPYTDDGITAQVKEFIGLVFEYKGGIHSPRYLKLTWASLCFNCRLTELALTYTLFKPDGTPLRARGDATFLQFTSEALLAKEANQQSPDVTHVRTVRAGDTLPLLCWEIYGSSEWYWRVAAANGLAGFRDLRVGTQLVFPPLQASPA
ncbi:MAG TPA: tail protein X [Longimicrobium sp.]|jgi:phage tail protein X|nr:tail protein X [Longimicrobium sp.]